MTRLTAICFDVDGTLLNTSEFVQRSYEYVLGTILPPADHREQLRRMFGKPLDVCYQELAPGFDPVPLMKLHDEFQERNMDLVQPFEDVESTLLALKARGIAVAAVTNRKRDSTITLLEVSDLTKHIDLVIAIEDVVNPKPHPEGVLKALTHFQQQPESAAMVGDSEFDIMAGKGANTRTIGVTTGLAPELMKQEEPDYVFDSIRDILTLL